MNTTTATVVKLTTQVTVLPHPELCPSGLVFDARQGRKLVDELLAQGITIEHACEKVCARATCHVHVRAGAEFLAAADEEEEDQLNDAWGRDAQSRLSCCVKVKGASPVIEMPLFLNQESRAGEVKIRGHACVMPTQMQV